jgi:magnesium transporter
VLIKTDEARPYRFTFFTDNLTTTVHSPTISELVDQGEEFKELFEGEDSDCWWLDVTNVTDEELRTLSRVNLLLYD